MASIVALVEGGQDVIAVVSPVAVRLYNTDLVSLWRARDWYPRRVWGGADIGPPRQTCLCGCAGGCCKGSQADRQLHGRYVDLAPGDAGSHLSIEQRQTQQQHDLREMERILVITGIYPDVFFPFPATRTRFPGPSTLFPRGGAKSRLYFSAVASLPPLPPSSWPLAITGGIGEQVGSRRFIGGLIQHDPLLDLTAGKQLFGLLSRKTVTPRCGVLYYRYVDRSRAVTLGLRPRSRCTRGETQALRGGVLAAVETVD